MSIKNLPLNSIILPEFSVPESPIHNHNEEEADAAAVLASLGIQNIESVTSSFRSPSMVDTSVTETHAVGFQQSSDVVLPKIVNAPRRNDMTVDHTYRDFSVIDETVLASIGQDKGCNEKVQKVKNALTGILGPFTTRYVGGVVKPFPEKLMDLLARPDMESIIAWKPHGRAFVVLSPTELEKRLPTLFKQHSITSFVRQLNLWNFKRLNRKGDDYKSYYHELFLRGRPELAKIMRRHKIKGVGTKRTPNPENEPNFYKMKTVDSSSSNISVQVQNLSARNLSARGHQTIPLSVLPGGLLSRRTNTDIISAMTDYELIQAIQHQQNLTQPRSPPIFLQPSNYKQQQEPNFKISSPSINLHELQMLQQQLPNGALWNLLSNQQNLPVEQNLLLSSLFQQDQVSQRNRANSILLLLATNGISM